jgi:large repetitive protein
VHDNGGTANGGVDTSAPQTFNITITFVNDAPSFTKGPDINLKQDSQAQTFSNWATKVSPDQNFPPAANEAGQILTFLVTNNNPGLFAVQPSISGGLYNAAGIGTLTFTPMANMLGSAIVTVQLQDNGGTANNGVDTSAPQTFVIQVTFVNQAPSFTKGPDQTVLENTTGVQTVNGWATKVSPDQNYPPSPLEAGQHLNFIVTTNNPSLFAVAPSITGGLYSDPGIGTLTYTLAPEVSGTAVVTVMLHDDGGTANSGVDTSAAQMFNITVQLVNDAPTFTKGADQTVLEDSGAQTVTGWATKVSPDQNYPTPAANEAGQQLNWLVTNSNPSLFSVQPTISGGLYNASGIGTLTYTLAPDASGTAVVTVQLHDNGGTANNGVDTSAAQTFNITVTLVNDVPSFTKGPDQNVQENTGAHSVGWATNVSPDQHPVPASNEAGQTLTFLVSSSNPALFAVQPSISGGLYNTSGIGTLSYQLATNVFGSATVTVQLMDNGGTANGGVDTSAAQFFNITVVQPTTSTVLTSSLNPSQFTQPVTFTATVTSNGGTPSGSVIFTVDNTPTTVSLNSSGVATLTFSNLTVGLHTVLASYQQSPGFAGSTAQQLVQSVTPVGTSTGLASSLNPSIFGQAVTFTATVTPAVSGTGTPGGTVTFSIDGTPQSPVTLNNAGVAIFSSSTLSAGMHQISATYSGGGNFSGSSTATPLTQNVLSATTTALTSGPINPSVFGQTVTFTATITSASPGTPTGTVQFFLDSSPTPSFTSSLNGSAQATFPISTLSLGNHTVTATYLGDNKFGQSSTTGPITQTVQADGTTTTITEPGGPTVFGQQASLVATVHAASPGSGTPTGALQFFIDGAPQAPLPVGSSGQATLNISTLSVGTHAITALFTSGDSNFTGSQTAKAFAATVNKANTTASVIDVVTSPTVLGEMAIFVANIAPNAPGAGLPTGNVQFVLDGTTLPTVYALNANGQAGLDISTLSLGTHTISVDYFGDGHFNGSNDLTKPLSHVVGQLKTTTIVAPASSSPTTFGQLATFYMQVIPARQTGFTPTGGMQFILDGVAGPVIQLNSFGMAGLYTSTLSAGTHTLFASYGGDIRFAASGTPKPLIITVLPISTSTTLVSSVNPSAAGTPVTFTATTTATGGAALPAGSADVFSIPGVLAPTPVAVNSAGQASITVSNLTQGTDNVSVQFNSSSGNFGGSSTALTQAVLKASIVTVSAQPTSSTFGQAVTLSATVNPAVSGSGTPTGSVSFVVNGISQPAVALNGNQATLTLTTLPAGNDSINAVYNGDTNFGPSGAQTAATVSVSKSTTTTSVFQLGATSTVFGQLATFIATVKPALAGAGVASGSLEFVVDGTPQAPVALNGNGQAGLYLSTLAVGSHTIGAIFIGGPNLLGSTATTIGTTVNKAQPTISVIEIAPAPTSPGQLATFILTVTPPFPGSAIPTGGAQFIVDGVPQPVLQLNANGQDGLYISTLALGQHNILASYGGNGNYLAAGTHQPFVASVVPPTTAVRLSSPNFTVAANTLFNIGATALTTQNTTATSFNSSATITLTSAPSGATVNGPTTGTFSSGTATFSGFTVDTSGSYIFHIVAGNLTVDVTITATGGRQT